MLKDGTEGAASLTCLVFKVMAKLYSLLGLSILLSASITFMLMCVVHKAADKPFASDEHALVDGRVKVPIRAASELQLDQERYNFARKCKETSEELIKQQESPWFTLKNINETYLVFYGKPSMQGLWNIGSSRGWKVKHILKGELNKLWELITPERFLVMFTYSGAYHHKLIRNIANSSRALIGAIENAFKVTGSKQTELTSFRSYFQSFDCSLEDTGIMPRFFILDDPKDCVQFFRYLRMQPKSIWFLKPSHGHNGGGITMHSNLTFFYKEYATCMKKPDSIVQEYVANPLLLEKRKFDLRAYILIAKTAPYYLVFYHDGYVRRAVREFDIHGSREVHLTNTDIQALVEGFLLDDHIWSFRDLQNYLNVHRPDCGKNFVSNKLVPFITKLGKLLVYAGQLNNI